MYGPEEWYYDGWVSYERSLFNGRVDWTVQLNVRNLFGDDDPVPVLRQPNGMVAAVRIAQPREEGVPAPGRSCRRGRFPSSGQCRGGHLLRRGTSGVEHRHEAAFAKDADTVALSIAILVVTALLAAALVGTFLLPVATTLPPPGVPLAPGF